MATHEVHVKDNSPGGEYKYKVRKVEGYGGDLLTFKVKDKGHLFFPHGKELFIEGKTVYEIPGNGEVTVQLLPDRKLKEHFGPKFPKEFRYAVYCEKGGESGEGDFAESESAPVIIIDESTK